MLSGLPINLQSHIDTPYLDHSLYIYDEKVINNQERLVVCFFFVFFFVFASYPFYCLQNFQNIRPRACPELPIKFWSRVTKQVKFKLQANPESAGQLQSHSRFPKYANEKSLISLFLCKLFLKMSPLTTFFFIRRYVHFIFHPFHPFIMSILFSPSQASIINFHFR